MALADGIAIETHVLNLINSLVDGKVTGDPNIDTLQFLILPVVQ